MRRIALLAGVAFGVVTAAVFFALRAAGKGSVSGFLGPGSLLADLNLVLELLLVLGLTAGILLARGGKVEAHRVNQTIWALVNVALVVAVMIPSLENAKLGKLADLAHGSAALPWLHAAVGALTVASALWLVLQMNDILPTSVHISWWKTLMRATLAGYWIVALLGIAIYYQWNVG